MAIDRLLGLRSCSRAGRRPFEIQLRVIASAVLMFLASACAEEPQAEWARQLREEEEPDDDEPQPDAEPSSDDDDEDEDEDDPLDAPEDEPEDRPDPPEDEEEEPSEEGDDTQAPFATWIAYTFGDGNLAFVKTDCTGSGGIPKPGIGAYLDPSWSTDGRSLAVVWRPNNIDFPELKSKLLVFDYDEGEQTEVEIDPVDDQELWFNRPRWSNDDATLIVQGSLPGGPVSLWAIPVAGGAPRQITQGEGMGDRGHDVGPGDVLYFLRENQVGGWFGASVHLDSRPGAEPERLGFGGNLVGGLSVSADGEHVMFAIGDPGNARIVYTLPPKSAEYESQPRGDWADPEYLHVGSREYVVVHDGALTVRAWDGTLEKCGAGMPVRSRPQVSSAEATEIDIDLF